MRFITMFGYPQCLDECVLLRVLGASSTDVDTRVIQ